MPCCERALSPPGPAAAQARSATPSAATSSASTWTRPPWPSSRRSTGCGASSLY